MQDFIKLLKDVRENGVDKSDRTGIGCRSVFGRMMRWDLSQGFPLVTTKKIHLKSIIHELLWFLSGNTNIGYLKENNVNIWDAWADKNGDLGPIYGAQWRSWPTAKGPIDQISNVIEQIKNNRDSRRLIVSSWNVADLENMALSPCHALFQFYVANNKLSCNLYQRSADLFLGVPFNIASYSLLTMMIAQVANLELGEFIWTGGDCHIYSNHFDQVDLQMTRIPFKLPNIIINKNITDIFQFKYEDFLLNDYICHPSIKGSVAV